MKECWFCGRTLEELQKLIKNMPEEVRARFMEIEEIPVPVCYFCYLFIVGLVGHAFKTGSLRIIGEK